MCSVYRRVFETLEKKMANGTQRDCYAVQYLKIAENENFTENQKFFGGKPPSNSLPSPPEL
jgi:hypothetical protein